MVVIADESQYEKVNQALWDHDINVMNTEPNHGFMSTRELSQVIHLHLFEINGNGNSSVSCVITSILLLLHMFSSLLWPTLCKMDVTLRTCSRTMTRHW